MSKAKKLAIFSFVVVLMIAAAVTSATSALYTSSASNDGNNFESGTLVISQQRNNDTVTTAPMFYGDPSMGVNAYTETESVGGIAPGDNIIRSLVVKNDGSLDAKVTKLFATVTSGESNPGYAHFIKKLNVRIINTATNTVLYNGRINALLEDGGFTIPSDKVFNIYSGGTATLKYRVTLAKGAGNQIQGQTFVFDFSIFAEQLANN
ncbi:hypothetical protein CIB95_12260 [Lottiidibacillus patelloidae]|uniref:Uncharacterized protein n=1 Tax=Lottiidibacillus patelloidae TaxID=2670334 RepID=A0A263BSJ1_9BACI|nr:hypothetical protein [Lottiidibacillus patelloidae]OZM56538.1 hypothetical protein CIB95_12260 [Lottiidibacillus patelloidae]